MSYHLSQAITNHNCTRYTSFPQQGSTKILRPNKVDAPAPSWWNKVFVGEDTEVNKRGTSRYEIAATEHNKDYKQEQSKPEVRESMREDA